METRYSQSTPPEPNEPTDAQTGTKYNRMLAVRHVAQLLGIHESTVRMWADSGVLESYRIGPRQDRRIPLECVTRTLEAAKRWHHLPIDRK